VTLDVVVATYNRPAALRRCMEALAAQTVLPGRVIVVDDHSPEPVAAATFRDLAPLVVHVQSMPQNGGPAPARNAGVAASTADVVLFVDDDVVADAHLVERHTAAHAVARSLAVIGPLAAPADWRPTPWNRWEAATLRVEYERMERAVYAPTWRQFFTGNASVRREDFERAGGFDSRFGRAEDIELGIRLGQVGCAFVFDSRAIGWHYAYRTRKQWLRIARDYAVADAAIAELYPRMRWKQHLEGEASERHRLIRGLGSALRPLRGEYVFAEAASRGSSLLSRMGGAGLADRALSAAYAVSYQRAARDVSRGANPWGIARDDPAQAIHPPSTAMEEAQAVQGGRPLQ
jgi:GT2 family glycosyltransferase